MYYSGYSLDLDGDGYNDVDYAATRSNIETVFKNLSDVVTNGDVVFFSPPITAAPAPATATTSV